VFAILGAFTGVFMDPNELIKAAPEIAKGAAALGAAIPFTGVVKRMLGPAADELAERWRDSVRLYRFGRQLECLKKAERMALEAGFTPQAVPIKLLFPLLEGASLEEDENLHDMWAALLSNAASPDNGNKVRPGFLATLTQMAPDEAAILNWMVELRTGPLAGPFNKPFSYGELMEAYKTLGFETVTPSGSLGVDSLVFETCLENLEAEKLIEISVQEFVPSFVKPRALTFRGLSFVMACRPPKPKK
jgi:hypothetical protein